MDNANLDQIGKPALKPTPRLSLAEWLKSLPPDAKFVGITDKRHPSRKDRRRASGKQRQNQLPQQAPPQKPQPQRLMESGKPYPPGYWEAVRKMAGQ